jgi:GT2 family glycosyltransferase
MVKLIESESNRGFAAGTNLGIRNSSGKLIALFNYDATAEQTWLEKLVLALECDLGTGIVAGPIFYYDRPNIIWSAGGRINFLTGTTWQLYQGFTVSAEKLREIGDIDFVPGCGLLTRKEVVDDIGLLDEHYFLYLEDVDWAWAARSAGYKVKFVSDAKMHHHVSSSWAGRNEFGYYHVTRSRFHLLMKYLPRFVLWLPLTIQLLGLSVAEVFVFHRPNRYVSIKLEALRWNIQNRKMSARAERPRNLPVSLGFFWKRLVNELGLVRERIASRKYYW